MIDEDTQKLIQLLSDEGWYTDICVKGDMICGIYKLIYTHAIIVDMSESGYERRYCYSTYDQAKSALEQWDGTSEPLGYKAKR